jgi:SAM-dependent methyltransferase
MNRQDQTRIDDLYKNTPLEEIPWNSETPPELLVELVDSGKVHPCKAVDLGCGAGNYAIYLAGRGFEVTGIDFSPAAIRIAKENAKKKSVKCNFFVADVIDGLDKINQTWDFAYDWGLLHHILPENRSKYVENVHSVLKPAGKYVSVCFNEKDVAFEGSGKYRQTSMGTVVYLSSEKELRKLFERFFRIIDFRVLEITGKIMTHIFNYCLMEWKRQ